MSDEDTIPERLFDASARLDHVFDVLSHPRRRFLLRSLQETPGSTLEAHAERVASLEGEVSPTPAVTVERVLLSLDHVHVPLLVDHGVVRAAEDGEPLVLDGNADLYLDVLADVRGRIDARQARPRDDAIGG